MAQQEFELDATYGKQSVPVFKIRKQSASRHEVIDLIVKIMLRGDISASWEAGKNHQIVPTETQKNTCYALALATEYESPEDYALALARDMLKRHKHLDRVDVQVKQRVWARHVVDGREHAHVFLSSPQPVARTCTVRVVRGAARATVTSGVCDVRLLKTTKSGFTGFIEDEYTNLKPVGSGQASPDRIMSTEMTARWTWMADATPEGAFKDLNDGIVQTLLDTFSGPADTGKYSRSLQETAYEMAAEVLRKFSAVADVYIATPNVHYYPYPLEQFGLKNPNVVFQSTDCETTASGRIVTHLSRKLRSRI